MGEITGETAITNSKDGSVVALKEVPELVSATEEEDQTRPLRTSIRFNLQQRIRELEEALMEERRAREDAEHHLAKLEVKLDEITRTAMK
jgi:hypothetical protein